MSFGWLGTFRQGSWREFRRFVLEERRDIDARIATIQAELSRIGEVTVFYRLDADGDEDGATEERTGIFVTGGSSLEKLFQAYVALGGNPFDISLFLTPDATIVFPDETEAVLQPGEGVVYPKDGTYSIGTQYQGSMLNINKYVPGRIGSRRTIEDSRIAGLVEQSRRWTNQALRYKRNDLEARIIKLADLREQLLQELDELTLAAGGTVPAISDLDQEQFEKEYGVAGIIAAIDSIFYEMTDDNTAIFEAENPNLINFPNLMPDVSPDEDNTAL